MNGSAGLLACLVLAGASGLAAQDTVDERSTLLAEAAALLREGDPEQAAERYATLVEREPADIEALEGRVRALFRADRWRVALAEAEAARGRAPADMRVATLLAEALFRAGRLTEVDAALAGLDEAGDAPGRAWITRARLRAAEGRRAEADLATGRALERGPEDPEVLYWAGDLAGSRAEAIALLERYLARSAGDDPDRIESASGAVRVMRELADRQVWVPRNVPESVELRLRRLWEADGRTVGYVAEARVGEGGKPVRLLLDTGSPGLFVLERIAEKRGFEAIAERTIFGGGGERRHPTRRGIFTSWEMGGLAFGDALATTSRDEMDATGRFHGLLGLAVFGGYRVTLDLDAARLRLERNASPLDGAPYWWVAGQLLVEASAGGKRGLFVLDTGAAATVLSQAFASEVDPDSLGRAAAVRGFGGAVTGAREVRGIEVRFGGLSVGSGGLLCYDLSVPSRLGGVEVAGLLGLDVLAGRTLRLDTVTQRIAVESD